MWFVLFIILILCFIAVIFGVSLLVGLVQTKGVPFVSTPQKYFSQILQAAELQPGEKFFDLGCGRAHLLISAAKKYGITGIGYELSLWPYVLAQINIWWTRAKVKVFCRNFFRADLSSADVVFCYLFPEIMIQLEEKFKRELKPGSRVITYDFKLPHITATKSVAIDGRERIFVYRF